MTSIEKRHLPTERLALAAILTIAAGVRCFGLGVLPAFIDEIGHIRFVNDLHPSFYQIGKVLGQYMFRPIVNHASDPLTAVRLFVAMTGVITVLGTYLVTKQVAIAAGGNIRIAGASGLLAAALWALQPMVVFHDRMALHDPLVSLFYVWALWASMEAFRLGDKRFAAAAGLLCGLAAMVKFPMIFLFGTCVLVGISQLPRQRWRSAWPLIAVMAAAVLPPFAMLWPNRDKFLVSVGQYAQAPDRLTLLNGNLSLVVEWFAGYNSVWYLVLLAVAFAFTLKSRKPILIALLFCFVAPVLAMCASLSFFSARYILPILIPATVMTGVAIPLVFALLLQPGTVPPEASVDNAI